MLRYKFFLSFLEAKVEKEIINYLHNWSSHRDSAVMNPTSIHEDTGLAQWVKDPALP